MIKKLGNIWSFLAIFCLCFFLETITHTYLVSTIQSIERQFQIPSRLSGGLVSAGEIGYILTVVFLSYFGSHGHRARWIGAGCMLISGSCLLISLPYFLFDHRESMPVNGTGNNPSFSLCRSADEMDVSSASCTRKKRPNEWAFGLVFVGIVLIGVGHSMPWSLGVPLIDDNVKKKSTPLYFAGVFFIRILGPVSGFLVGGACNKLYFNFNPPAGLGPGDPRWIGSWWLGFLIIGVALVLPSLLLFCFPADVIEKQKQEKLSEESGSEKLLNQTEQVKKEARSLLSELKHFATALLEVLRCPVYVGILCAALCTAFALKGFLVFMPKYLDSHFGVPPFKANTYIAVMGVGGFALGIASGSGILHKFRLEGRRAVCFVGVCDFLGASISFICIAIGCHSVLNSVGKAAAETGFNLTDSCNKDCLCEASGLLPVCSRTGVSYFSPCAASCTNSTPLLSNSFPVFSSCSCAMGETSVSRDWCSDDCSSPLLIYFVLMTLAGFFGGNVVIPTVLLLLRSVPTKHRSVALGFSGFAVSLISTFPSPIVYGYWIDGSCLLWEEDCGVAGACLLYDPSQLRHLMHQNNGLFRAAVVIIDVWIWYWARNLKLLDEKEEKEEKIRMEELNPSHKTQSNAYEA